MKFCPKCKKDYLIFCNFCRCCGGKLKEKRELQCPKCKDRVFGKFCETCGLKFDNKSKLDKIDIVK